MAYDSSTKNEPKRSHQWFMDGTESDLFPNKRQAVEVPSNTFFPGMANLNVSPWGTAPGFHSVPTQFTQRVFDSETEGTVNYEDRNIPSFSAGDMNMNLGRKVEDFFGINSSIGLSTSHSLDDPKSGLYYGGIRKAKVNQVKDPDNAMSASMGGAFSSGNSDSAPKALHKEGENSISMGLTYSGGDKNVISRNETFNREDSSFISMGQHYNKGNENMFVGQPYNEGDANISVNHTYKESNGSISVSQQFSNVQTYKKDGNRFMSMGPATHALTEGGDRVSASTLTYNNSYHDQSSISRSCNKRESNIISFGDFRDDDETDPSGRLLCSYDFLMGQPSVQRSEAPNEELNPNAFTSVSQVIASGSETVPKKKETQKLTKKAPPNNFPSNVRSLLSTGMLDGVPVKYIAWSREKQLCGVIKGSGYLCGCRQCNSSKVVNAYEFERHAGCKTKHPNNHIYFENGKTIYAIVQELRSTPQNLLFEVIQTITGSPINQKSFRLWKESFLAATRELQRIYGKDEGGQLS